MPKTLLPPRARASTAHLCRAEASHSMPHAFLCPGRQARSRSRAGKRIPQKNREWSHAPAQDCRTPVGPRKESSSCGQCLRRFSAQKSLAAVPPLFGLCLRSSASSFSIRPLTAVACRAQNSFQYGGAVFGRLRPFPYCPRLSDAFRATVRNPRERGHVERPGILRTLPPSGPFFLRKAGAAVSDGIADVRPFLAAVPFLSCPQHGVSALSQLEKPRCGTPASYMCAARLSAYPRRHRPHPRKSMSSGSGTPPEQSHPAGCKSQNRPFKGRFDLTL